MLGAPSNHAGRNSTGIWGVNRQGCRFSRPAPWMARDGGPRIQAGVREHRAQARCRVVGQERFAYFCLGRHSGFSKVSRCQSGTLSGRYLNNGYVLSLIPHPGRLSGRLRRQASSHIWIAGRQVDRCRLSGRHRRQASSHIWIAARQRDRHRLSGRLRRQASSHSWISPHLGDKCCCLQLTA